MKLRDCHPGHLVAMIEGGVVVCVEVGALNGPPSRGKKIGIAERAYVTTIDPHDHCHVYEPIPVARRRGNVDAELTMIYELKPTGYSRGDGHWFVQFFDRATQCFFGGSGESAFEAVAWAMDEYVSRIDGPSVARSPTARPGDEWTRRPRSTWRQVSADLEVISVIDTLVARKSRQAINAPQWRQATEIPVEEETVDPMVGAPRTSGTW